VITRIDAHRHTPTLIDTPRLNGKRAYTFVIRNSSQSCYCLSFVTKDGKALEHTLITQDESGGYRIGIYKKVRVRVCVCVCVCVLARSHTKTGISNYSRALALLRVHSDVRQANEEDKHCVGHINSAIRRATANLNLSHRDSRSDTIRAKKGKRQLHEGTL